MMATTKGPRQTREVEYPTSDGKPMAESDLHRDEMVDTIYTLQDHFAARPLVYVSGNLLLYYEEGNPRKRIAPDVLVALDVPKMPLRDYYLVWKEGKAPDFVAEITSKSTRREDQRTKLAIYRDILRVSEYALFDPRADYLEPPLQGYRLVGGDYVPIQPVAGRLPSQVLGLHLERDGESLRLFDPATGQRLLTRLEGWQVAEREAEEAHRQFEEAHRQAEEAHRRAEEAHRRAEAAEAEHRRLVAEAECRRLSVEAERLRREIEALRTGQGSA